MTELFLGDGDVIMKHVYWVRHNPRTVCIQKVNFGSFMTTLVNKKSYGHSKLPVSIQNREMRAARRFSFNWCWYRWLLIPGDTSAVAPLWRGMCFSHDGYSSFGDPLHRESAGSLLASCFLWEWFKYLQTARLWACAQSVVCIGLSQSITLTHQKWRYPKPKGHQRNFQKMEKVVYQVKC